MNPINKILTLLFFIGLTTTGQHLSAQDGAQKLTPVGI
jgi:hypothetical protein